MMSEDRLVQLPAPLGLMRESAGSVARLFINMGWAWTWTILAL